MLATGLKHLSIILGLESTFSALLCRFNAFCFMPRLTCQNYIVPDFPECGNGCHRVPHLDIIRLKEV